jgi:FkbM family methyltransferase
MEEGKFEPAETQIIHKLLRQVDVVINVGANIGYYCCLALSCGKHVVAFEPIDLNLRYLYKNIKANSWEDKIEVFPLVLNGKTGITAIYGGGTGASIIKGWAGTSEKYVTLVPASTMDNILGSRFQDDRCFVLVDIEGAEKYMLEGANNFLDREPRPVWMVEIAIHGHQPGDTKVNPNLLSTFQIFWKNGYEAWTADKQCRCIYSNEIERIIATGKDTLATHNFIFIEEGRKGDIIDA